MKYFDAGHAYAYSHKIWVNPIINKKWYYCYYDCWNYAENFAYSDSFVYLIPENYKEIEELIETDKHKKNSNYISEVSKSHKRSLEVFESSKIHQNGSCNDYEKNCKHLLPQNRNVESTSIKFKRPDLWVKGHAE